MPNTLALCIEVKPQLLQTKATEGKKDPPNCMLVKLSCKVLAKYPSTIVKEAL